MRRALLVCLFSVVVAAAVLRAQVVPADTVQGVWRVVEVADSSGTNNDPQPSLFIFTPKYYSLIQVVGSTARKSLADINTATAAEILAVYGNAFQAQAGTYRVTPGFLILRPTVAKAPAVMASGSSVVYTFKKDGDQLIINGGGRGGVQYRLQRLE